jgi:DNA-binding CsgD family transcriptional regulator
VSAETPAAVLVRPAAPPPLLTARQLAVLRLTANGHTIRSAARVLGKSEHGVADLMHRVHERLGVRSSAHGVAVALALGLIGLDEIRMPERQGGAVGLSGGAEAPRPRRGAAGRSGGDGAGFNGAGRASGAGAEAAERPVRPSRTPEAPEPHRDAQKPPQARTAPQETPPCPN